MGGGGGWVGSTRGRGGGGTQNAKICLTIYFRFQQIKTKIIHTYVYYHIKNDIRFLKEKFFFYSIIRKKLKAKEGGGLSSPTTTPPPPPQATHPPC